MIEKAAVEFCYVNSKTNRRRLVKVSCCFQTYPSNFNLFSFCFFKAIFNVPRTQLVLLPYYARLAAILSPYMKDVGTSLVAMVCIISVIISSLTYFLSSLQLEEEFNYLFNKKDQMNIETKVKVRGDSISSSMLICFCRTFDFQVNWSNSKSVQQV